MYDVGDKLWSEIKSIHVDSSACVKVKGGESERFRIDSWVRQGCITSLWLFNVYMDGVMKEGSELHGGWKRMETTWPLECRCEWSMW